MKNSSSNNKGVSTDCGCNQRFLELLLDGLQTARPQRFIIDNNNNNNNNNINNSLPSFQLLFSTVNDHVYFPCMRAIKAKRVCRAKQYPPLLVFGSVPKTYRQVASFLHPFPTMHYHYCLEQWRRRPHRRTPCTLRSIVTQPFPNTDDVWDDDEKHHYLIPQIYWRGTDLKFLEDYPEFSKQKDCTEVLMMAPSFPPYHHHTNNWTLAQAAAVLRDEHDSLVPRCRAVAMTLEAESSIIINSSDAKALNHIPWINVKYAERRKKHLQKYQTKGLMFLLSNYTSPLAMSRYKYQIDFGGMGGTTWLGTITKLAMPGLLFHHETPTQDWFHHDELQPWVHYVPIHTNLSNLYDMYIWAETHPEQAKIIAKQGQDYARWHVSDEHFQATFERLYVDDLGRIADAYMPSEGETLETILDGYKADGLSVVKLWQT